MKKYLLCSLAAAAIANSAIALVNLGEGRIDLDLRVTSFYDSEIQGRAADQDDFVFSFRPSLTYTRPSPRIDLSASIGVDFIKYLDFDEYDDANVTFDLGIAPSAQRETSRFRFSGDLILNTETRSNDTVGEIVTILNYGASGQVIYDPNRRFSIIGDASWTREDPDSDVYNKVDNFELSGALQVPVNEDLYIQGSIGYLDTSSDGITTDSETYTYSAGFGGILLPKLEGSLFAGIQDRKFENRDGGTNPYFSANLDWTVDERSRISLTGSQSLGTTIDDRSSDTLSISLTGRRDLSRDLSASLFVSYSDTSYDSLIPGLSRNDEEVAFGGSLTYQLVRWGSIGLEARYSDRSSDDEEFEYDRTRIGAVFNGTW